jgi:RNA polymerase sigma-70 factor (ECF subfamily)
MEPDDGAVIRESLATPQRFGEIFERHYDAIYAFLARRLGADLGGELAAETFTRAFAVRRRFRIEQSSSARPWLFGVATNLLKHHHRTEARRLRAYARTGVDPVLDATPDVDRRVDADAVAQRLAEALGSLRNEERDVLLLFAWADLSYAEIAEALDLEDGTVRSRLSRARSRVRELLEPGGQQVVETAPSVRSKDG